MIYSPGTKPAAGEALRLLTVSNRGPVEFHRDAEGRVVPVPGQGGLSTALSTAASLYPTTWLSSPLTAADRGIAEQSIDPPAGSDASHFVATDAQAYELYYGCFANEVLWFLQHGMEWPAELTTEQRMHAWRDGYVAVNRAFAEKIIEELESGAYRAVAFHDYHFYVAPRLVREARPDVFMQHFIHIPWAEPEQWARLEIGVLIAICEGLLANDSLVFQTQTSVRNFLLTCEMALPGARIDLLAGTILHEGHSTRVWSNGISVDPQELEEAARSAEFSRYRYLLRGDDRQKTIVRVDRLDPTKNVLAGFQAFERLVEEHPEQRGKVSFLALLVPTKSDIEIYRRYQDEGAAFVPDYLRLLSAGGSMAPEELGRLVGIDLADPGFWDAGLVLVEQQLVAAEQAAVDAGRA